ncbi:hypothetical protein GCM10027053_10610 [Intrasporangium mesophilum]
MVAARSEVSQAVKRYATQSTKASARLEQRTVPPGYKRSKDVERFLAQRLPRSE